MILSALSVLLCLTAKSKLKPVWEPLKTREGDTVNGTHIQSCVLSEQLIPIASGNLGQDPADACSSEALPTTILIY